MGKSSALAALLLVVACTDRTGPHETALRVAATADSATLVLDGTLQLSAARLDAGGHPLGGRLYWTSNDGSIARVDTAGVVTATGLGTTFIEVSDSRHSDTIPLRTYGRYRAVQAGEDVTCALATSGRAVCWGWNGVGSLGTGDALDHPLPAVLPGPTFFTLTVGAASVCGLAASGTWCWGYNGVGQLGDNTTGQHGLPVRVADTLRLKALALGAGTTACAFDEAGTTGGGFVLMGGGSPAMCWGWNRYGQLLDGGGVNAHRPKRIDAGRALLQLAPGGHHVCAIDDTGSAWCWGRGDLGQLGNGAGADAFTPVPVSGGLLFTALVSGITHTCGLTATREAWCWGDNSQGQLGTSGLASASAPQPVAAPAGFEQIATTAAHTCGLVGTTAWCWGDNGTGQLGRGTLGGTGTPATVAGGIAFTAISAGMHHTCGVDVQQRIWCWGLNNHGQLGDGSTTGSAVPVLVARQ